MVQRLNVRTLTDQQKKDFVDAILILKSKGIYDEYVRLHTEAMMRSAGSNGRNFAHYGPIFLPWHREFLRRFENDLRLHSNNSDLTLPYWDWAQDSLLNNPEESPIWSEIFMGGNGDRRKRFAVQNGEFAADKWKVINTNGKEGVLIRSFALIPGGSTLPTETDVKTAMNQMPYDRENWDVFQLPLVSGIILKVGYLTKLHQMSQDYITGFTSGLAVL